MGSMSTKVITQLYWMFFEATGAIIVLTKPSKLTMTLVLDMTVEYRQLTGDTEVGKPPFVFAGWLCTLVLVFHPNCYGSIFHSLWVRSLILERVWTLVGVSSVGWQPSSVQVCRPCLYIIDCPCRFHMI